MKIKKYINKFLFSALFLGTVTTSCVDDLNTTPIDDSEYTSEKAWREKATYTQFLAKMYAGLTLSGNEGPAGEGDLSNGDQGIATFTRGLWNLQEMTTDEALCVWDNEGMRPLQFNQWGPANNYCYQFFQRAMLNVAYANEYLRETADAKLDGRGMSTLKDEVAKYREEARTLRALNYLYLLDLYGIPPFITENDPVGASAFPAPLERAKLFEWIESELKAIEANNVLPQKSYSRMSIATVRTLLAKLYLNAEVWAGVKKYEEAAAYSKKVIDAYGELHPKYSNLFRADNDKFTDEIILGLPYDSKYATSYGGTTSLIAAAITTDMSPAANFGLDASWTGIRAPQELTKAFDKATDKRYMFWEDGRTQNVSDWSVFLQGYSVIKFSNVKSTDTTYPNPSSAPRFADTDFPLFRLADLYLMYVEALVRQGSSSADIATYFNKVRSRAGASTLAASRITLDEILNERLRELYWEGQRRTDLIRFGKYISGYNWTYKGGVLGGTDINPKYAVFPIPSLELGANPNLKQNVGY